MNLIPRIKQHFQSSAETVMTGAEVLCEPIGEARSEEHTSELQSHS